MTPDRVYYSAEAEAYARKERVALIIVAIALGLGIGAILALLFAPDEGEDTRKRIADALDEGYKRGRDSTNEALKQLEHEVPDLRKRVDDLVGKLKK